MAEPHSQPQPQPRPRIFESVSRRAYWIGIGGLIIVLVGLSWWGGLYYTQVPEENIDARVRNNDPLTEILYSPIGNGLMLLVFQFFVANILFWAGVWLWLRIRPGRR